MDFIVLSSSRGTTFQAVIDAVQHGKLTARCLGLVTDKPDRGCIAKAEAAKLPVKIVEKKENESREDYDKRVDCAIEELQSLTPNAQRPTPNPVLACLGWMFVFSPAFIAHHRNRIINVHPALLPKFGGKGMYGPRVHAAVLAAHEQESGITIHVMDEGVDTGPILIQKTCAVLHDDTAESLQKRVQELEKEWYPKVLQRIEEGSMPQIEA